MLLPNILTWLCLHALSKENTVLYKYVYFEKQIEIVIVNRCKRTRFATGSNVPVGEAFPGFNVLARLLDCTEKELSRNLKKKQCPINYCKGMKCLLRMPRGSMEKAATSLWYSFESGHLVLSHFGTCKCFIVETNLSWICLVSGLLSFEHPSVLLFCFECFRTMWVTPFVNFCRL